MTPYIHNKKQKLSIEGMSCEVLSYVVNLSKKKYLFLSKVGTHADFVKKRHLRDASSTRCIIYEMHHLQVFDSWDASSMR